MKRANRKALHTLKKLFKYASEKGKPFMGFTPEENADVGQVILDLVFYGWVQPITKKWRSSVKSRVSKSLKVFG